MISIDLTEGLIGMQYWGFILASFDSVIQEYASLYSLDRVSIRVIRLLSLSSAEVAFVRLDEIAFNMYFSRSSLLLYFSKFVLLFIFSIYFSNILGSLLCCVFDISWDKIVSC
jgi:hypothetical protein